MTSLTNINLAIMIKAAEKILHFYETEFPDTVIFFEIQSYVFTTVNRYISTIEIKVHQLWRNKDKCIK